MKHFQRGVSMIEMALVVSVTLLIVFGIMDFGRFMYTDHAVANLARAGSRWAMVRGSLSTSPATATTVSTYVQGIPTPLLAPASITVTTTWPGTSPGTITASAPTCPASAGGSPNAPGNFVCVQVSYTYNFIVLPEASHTFTRTSEMLISN